MTVEMATQLQMAAAAGQAPNVIPMPTDFSMPPPTTVPWGIRPQHNYVNQPFQSMSLEVNILHYFKTFIKLTIFFGSLELIPSIYIIANAKSTVIAYTFTHY